MAIVCIPYKPVIRGNSHVINLWRWTIPPHTPRVLWISFWSPRNEKKQFYLAGHLSNWLVVGGSAKSGINRSTTPTDPYGPTPPSISSNSFSRRTCLGSCQGWRLLFFKAFLGQGNIGNISRKYGLIRYRTSIFGEIPPDFLSHILKGIDWRIWIIATDP